MTTPGDGAQEGKKPGIKPIWLVLIGLGALAVLCVVLIAGAIIALPILAPRGPVIAEAPSVTAVGDSGQTVRCATPGTNPNAERYGFGTPSANASIAEGQSLFTAWQYEAALEAFNQGLEESPDDILGYLGRGWTLHGLHRYPEAEEDFRQAIELDPQNAAAVLGLGEALYRQYRYPQALETFEAALALNPDYGAAHSGRGRSLHSMGYTEDAIAAYERAIELDPGEARAYNSLGNYYNSIGESSRALEYFTLAKQCDPSFAFPYVGSVTAYLSLDQVAAAQREALAATVIDPREPLAWNNLAVVYRDYLRDYEGAVEALTMAVNLEPGNPMYLENRCGAYYTVHEYEAARLDCEQVLELNPQSARLYFLLSMIALQQRELAQAESYSDTFHSMLYESTDIYRLACILDTELGNYDLAISECQAALEVWPGNYRAYCSLGQVYEAQERWEEAIEAFSTSLNISPVCPEAFVGRANSLRALGEFNDALGDLEFVMARYPDVADAPYTLGRVYEDMGEPEQAIHYYGEAIALYDRDYRYYSRRAALTIAQGDYEPALDDLDRAVELAPDVAETYYLRALAHQGLGEIDAALIDLDLYRDAGGQSEDADALRLELEAARTP